MHRPRLGVVLCRVEVEVEQVLGRVLAQAQVARAAGLRAAHLRLLLVPRPVRGVDILRLVAVGLGGPALPLQRLDLVELVDDALVLGRVVAVPAVALGVPAEADVLHALVGGDVAPRPARALLARAAEALLGGVGHGAAVGAGALAELGRRRPRAGAAVVPLGGRERVVGLALQPLVLEVVARVVGHVEGLLGDEAWDVLVALVVLGRRGVGLARLAWVAPLRMMEGT